MIKVIPTNVRFSFAQTLLVQALITIRRVWLPTCSYPQPLANVSRAIGSIEQLRGKVKPLLHRPWTQRQDEGKDVDAQPEERCDAATTRFCKVPSPITTGHPKQVDRWSWNHPNAKVLRAGSSQFIRIGHLAPPTTAAIRSASPG